MEGVQANGEPKKIFLSKPENGNVAAAPIANTSRFSVEIQGQRNRVYIPPSRRPRPTSVDNAEEEEHVTNHKKQRYWNSYEEMYIVELWRRYKDEITEFNKPLPAHRKIMAAMRQKEMIVTGQDCRRKLNTLNNRYKNELQSQKLTGVKPEWRLFPLIHCIKSPIIKQYDPWHETKVLRKLLEKVPKPPELMAPAPVPIPTPVRQPLLTSHTYTNRSAASTPNSLEVSIPLQSIMTGMNSMNSLITMDNCVGSSTLPSLASSDFPYLPFRHITLQKYEQLKFDNLRLAKERDEDLKRLRVAEKNLSVFEALLQHLKRISSSVDNGIHIENEENTHVERNLTVK